MDTSGEAVKCAQGAAEGAAEARRRSYTQDQKRQIVAETLMAGVSVARVARRHGINANVVFTWRKQLRQATAVKLLPVQVADGSAPAPKRRYAGKPVPEVGFIEIELAGGHRVRVHGAADSRTVRSVIEALSR